MTKVFIKGWLVSLAYVSSETHNLQRVFRPPSRGGVGLVLPYIGYIGMCGAKGYGFFLAVLLWSRVSISTTYSILFH